MAGNINITIEQYSTWQLSLTIQDPAGSPVDLTGATAKMEIRAKPEGTLLATLSTAGGQIAIPLPLTGGMDLEIAAAATGILAFDTAQYDLVVTFPTGVLTRIIEGLCRLSEGVTEI